MRASLDKLFTAAAWASGLFMIGTLAAVLLGIASRVIGFDAPGTDAYAGYSMAAGFFLALAPTLRHGEHIRVTLLLNRLGGRARHALDLACHALGLALAGALAWYSVRLVWLSREMHDVSQGLDATPLWIPQIGMAVGCVLLCIAFAADFATLLRGSTPVYQRVGGEPARME